MLHGGAHWRHLANTIEPFMCGGNATFLSNYFDHLWIMLESLQIVKDKFYDVAHCYDCVQAQYAIAYCLSVCLSVTLLCQNY